MKKLVYFLAFIFCVAKLFSQQTPAKKQLGIHSIVGATAHVGDGTIIENSVLIFENGKIKVIGAEGSITPAGEIINAKGKHVYPGFIAPNTTLGLVEIDAVRASDDESEIGTFNPHIRSVIAYNTESKVVESMRPNGVLIAQITPRGGRISGTSSIVQLDAWNWEDAVLKMDDGVHINWPSIYKRGHWWSGEDPGIKPNDKYNEAVTKLKEYVLQAKASVEGNNQRNLPHLALKGVFEGDKALYIHINSEKAILDAIQFIKVFKIKRPVLVDADQAYKVAAQLKANNIPVLLERVHSTPDFDDSDYDLPYKHAKLLMDAGVTVAIQNAGDMERANVRNLPFQAGTVVAHGMSKEQALQLITLNAAKILGIDDQVGTLAIGKDATLFISKGDALDMRTNQLEKAFIQGRDISLETHQTALWKRYSKKYTEKK
ncbi:amidohydrolase family protein [Aquimarina agarivorans]|uniref:amidohydrolase family protein n=1 Tax=Aquimarina agarivorans TaxID=980584 RepID=UPI000248E5A7|nr:amidohydrolase family protein [Aquimarina agarivorans]